MKLDKCENLMLKFNSNCQHSKGTKLYSMQTKPLRKMFYCENNKCKSTIHQTQFLCKYNFTLEFKSDNN